MQGENVKFDDLKEEIESTKSIAKQNEMCYVSLGRERPYLVHSVET